MELVRFRVGVVGRSSHDPNPLHGRLIGSIELGASFPASSDAALVKSCRTVL